MQKTFALCMTALLLLAGCIGTDDVDDAVSIVGCDDETSLTYVENVTEVDAELCASEDAIVDAIVDFINLMDEGPDMENLDSTIGYSMEVSENYVNLDGCDEWEYWNPEMVDESQPYNGCPEATQETWHYLETVVVTPDGYKVTTEDNYGDESSISEWIISGNEIQFYLSNETEDFTVRMKHAGTFEDAMNMMMSEGDGDEGMDEGMVCHDMSTHTNDYSIDNQEDCEDAGYMWIPEDSNHDGMGDDNEMVCYDMSSHSILYEYDNAMDCEDAGYMWVEADSGPDSQGDDDGMDMDMDMDMDMEDGEDPLSEDYTEFYNPLTATFTGFAPDETGFTFSGLLNFEGAPFSILEIHTTSDFTVMGFTMLDSENEDNWVEFMLINSGDTIVDDTLQLSALPYILLDMSEMGMDDDSDDESMDEEMVCYDMSSHSILYEYDNAMDCEDAGYMWVEADSGPDSEGDEGSEGDEPAEEFHYYDNCDDENGSYECWMDEWDYDNDGDYEESHGYDYSDCSLESNGSWMCFAGYEDDGEEYSSYYCVPFVNYTTEGFAIFDSTNLDHSICGEPVDESMYEFDLNETWTMPTHLVWEDCWTEGNETVCEQGEITYNVNSTELWETTHENNYMDCDGDYDNNTSMCTEWIGNVTEADGDAFLISHSDSENLVMYQYNESTQSGLVIFAYSDDNDDGDMDPEMMFEMLDTNDDGEVTASEWADFTNGTDEPMSESDFDSLSMMMDMYDDDESGGLNYSEFEMMMANMDEVDDSEPDMAMFMAIGVLELEGDLDDYTVELTQCDGESLTDLDCSDAVYSATLSDIVATNEMMLFTMPVVFMDSDESGTLTSGDFVMVNKDMLDVDGEWNFARLHSQEADAYSDENPMMSMLPGFTGIIATIGLLGAALIRRE